MKRKHFKTLDYQAPVTSAGPAIKRAKKSKTSTDQGSGTMLGGWTQAQDAYLHSLLTDGKGGKTKLSYKAACEQFNEKFAEESLKKSGNACKIHWLRFLKDGFDVDLTVEQRKWFNTALAAHQKLDKYEYIALKFNHFAKGNGEKVLNKAAVRKIMKENEAGGGDGFFQN